MHLIYVNNQKKFQTEIIPSLISKYSISKVLLFCGDQNMELEVNLSELNLYLRKVRGSVKSEEFSLLKGNKNAFFYLKEEFWTNLNKLTKQLKNFFLLLEINKLQEIKELLKQNNINPLQKRLLGLFCFNKKSKSIRFYDLSLNEWKRVYIEENRSISLKEINKALRNSFKEQTIRRFQHTIRVLETAHLISSKLNLNYLELEKLLLACSYHDYSKNWTLRRLLYYSKKIFSNKSKEELLKEAWALHGPVASFILKRNHLLNNEEVLEAISYHTSPKKELGVIGKVLIIADKIELNKINYFPIPIYQELWKYLESGNIDYAFEFFLKHHNPKTEWRKESPSNFKYKK